MRKTYFAPVSKEYILDVTKSFAYEVHNQPKRIVRKPSRATNVLSRKLQAALSRLLTSLRSPA